MNKETDKSFSRRDFIKITGISTLGTFIPPEHLQHPNILPKPENPLLIKIIDAENPISELEIEKIIVPNLINIKDQISFKYANSFPTKANHIKIHKIAESGLGSIVSDMWAQGMRPYVVSGFRDIWAQEQAIAKAPDKSTVAEVIYDKDGLKYSTSQHSIGLAIDFTCRSINLAVDLNAHFEETNEGKWLDKNAWKYGYVQPFINNHEGIANESWHYLYVGSNLAKYYQSLKDAGWKGDIFALQKQYK